MIIDEVKIHVEAGKGGDGHVSFRREKFIPRGGPDGGNGGRGGTVFFVGVTDMMALRQFRYKKEVKAEDGGRGQGKKRQGAAGEDLLVKIPIGTHVIDHTRGREYDIFDSTPVMVARGGRGGKGNWEFRSNENKTPREFEPGQPAQFAEMTLNLQFIADVGLVGLPSAGKSSLLNALTKADVKVGDYPFTTLEANLGEMKGVILADIPGLIEGAHEGKGLGTKFLKHIAKTKIIAHCIDSTSDDVLRDYNVIRNELKSHDEKLVQKDEIIVLTKTDLVDDKRIKDLKKVLKKTGSLMLSCNIFDEKSLKDLEKQMLKSIQSSTS